LRANNERHCATIAAYEDSVLEEGFREDMTG
jgi:hypothetical protein